MRRRGGPGDLESGDWAEDAAERAHRGRSRLRRMLDWASVRLGLSPIALAALIVLTGAATLIVSAAVTAHRQTVEPPPLLPEDLERLDLQLGEKLRELDREGQATVWPDRVKRKTRRDEPPRQPEAEEVVRIDEQPPGTPAEQLNTEDNQEEEEAEVAGTAGGDARRVLVAAGKPFPCPGSEQPLLDSDRINDGFCDCPGSGYDEPGTAACSGLAAAGEPLFACGPVDGRRIFSARVGDGVCDCCDGSDEAGSSGTTCPDTCATLAGERAEREAARLAGAQLAGELANDPQVAQMRQGGEAAMSTTLFARMVAAAGKLTLNDGEFTYELDAASGSLTQRGQRSVQLGSKPQWVAKDKAVLLAGGDKCPSGVRRSALVAFECSSAAGGGQLVRVAEQETCVYHAVVAAPVGCLLDG